MLSADLHTEVSEARKIYMLTYEKALATYRQRFAASAPEVIFEVKDSSEAAPFRFSPRGIRLPTGMHITIHPIVWYRIEFVFGTQVTDDANLLKWCSLWLDLDEHRKPDETGFSGVIHSVTPPAFAENRTSFSVDFGSAPVMAFEECLTELHRAGVCSVTVGSFLRG